VDVEGDSEMYEEYEWAGQRRIRATTLLVGGFAGEWSAGGQLDGASRGFPLYNPLCFALARFSCSPYGTNIKTHLTAKKVPLILPVTFHCLIKNLVDLRHVVVE
jgi:hypothetical protein